MNTKFTNKITFASILAILILSISFAGEVPFERVVIDERPPASPWYKMAGDLNGNGRLDIIIAGSKGPLVWYAWPDWQKRQIADGGWNGVRGMTGDIDRDGHIDILMGGVVWFRNPGKAEGSWIMHRIDNVRTHDALLVDLNGNGRLDVVGRDQSAFGKSGNAIYIYRQDSPERWIKRVLSCPHGEGIQVADMTGNGRPDIVIGGRWYENPGDIIADAWKEHVYTTDWTHPDAKVDLADINGNGRLDVVLTPAELVGQTYKIAWYQAPADPRKGDWREHVVVAKIEAVIHSLALGDFNRDGHVDIAYAEMHQGADPDEVVIMLNQGRGAAWHKQILSTRGSHDLLAVDIDKNGTLDVLGANHGGPDHSIELWRNTMAAPAQNPGNTVDPDARTLVGAAEMATDLQAVPGVGILGNDDRIQPYKENPTYWQYKGEPVLLLGGSDTVNPFNRPDALPPSGLESHLDLLVSVGGNYIRNTMATYSDGELWPYHRDAETGRYNLDRFNEQYWQRFDDFLRMTRDRDIIVQIEVFDRFDYARSSWDVNPFNPKNNTNYTAEESGLPEAMSSHPNQRENPFFRSLPELEDNPSLLVRQEALVEKMISISLGYGNVLYCISNETNDSEEWSRHWAKFIRAKAAEAGIGVEVTEMWDAWNLNSPMHRRTFDHPDLYSYVDISQNNHQVGQTHWDNMQAARKLIAEPPRPMNNVKIYGGERHGGSVVEATRKLWHNVLGGCASARFHRPGPRPGFYGVGLGELAQTHLRSVRLLTAVFDVFRATPDVDGRLLLDRQANEAYLSYIPGQQYAVYFPDGGAVRLDLTGMEGEFTVTWLDISNTQWTDEKPLHGNRPVEIVAPAEGQWIALIKAIH